ncbi:MAG: dihydrofolate reductase [Phenylobacterium sp.]|jgi:dihydrofolate reductase
MMATNQRRSSLLNKTVEVKQDFVLKQNLITLNCDEKTAGTCNQYPTSHKSCTIGKNSIGQQNNMKISMIAAMAANRVIGKDNKMPWHLPADLKFFKKTTLAKPVIMGRKTFESIGRPLPKRHNIVITRSADFSADGITVVHDTAAALAAAGEVEEVMIIGGGHIYQQFLAQASDLYLTLIDLTVEGDAFFPDYQAIGQWQQVWSESHQKTAANNYDYQFVKLTRQD